MRPEGTAYYGIRQAARVAVLYVALAGLGVWLSDRLFARLIDHPSLLDGLQTVRNWVLIVTAGGLLFLLSRNASEWHRRNNRLLDAVVRASPAGIWATDNDRRITLWTSAAEHLLGQPAEAVLGRRLATVLPEVDQRFAGGRLEGHDNRVAREVDGTQVTLSIVTSPLNPASASQGYVWVATDVTERTRAERELRESRRLFVTLLRNLPGMAYRCCNDDSWTMEFVSDGCRELTGYAPSDLVANGSLAYADLILEEDRCAVWEGVQAAVREDRPFLLIYRIRRKDGACRWVWEQGRAVGVDENGLQMLEGFVTDITARKELEQQLQVAQKLEALGRLAGGMAHDFNNLLTVISGHSEMMLGRLDGDGSLRGQVDEIRSAGERAARLTRQLLAFSRRQPAEPRVIDLNAVVRDMSKLLSRLLGEDIRIEVRLDTREARVRMDPGQVEQMIMNLAVNARDAMPEGGRLTVDTGRTQFEAEYVRLHPESSVGHHVVLTVTDTGCGMDAETQAKIFDPFFTTKEPGKGTGLGLSTVYGVVKQSGGHIVVYSEPCVGTSFKIHLPAADSAIVDLPQESGSAASTMGSETVLLVEDEAPVRELVGEFLGLKGYTVLAAANAQEALELLQRAGQPVDVLATDLVMPGMNGRDLAARVRAAAPEVRVLYLSGYPEEDVVRQELVDPNAAFLSKPFQLDALAARLRHLIDEPLLRTR